LTLGRRYRHLNRTFRSIIDKLIDIFVTRNINHGFGAMTDYSAVINHGNVIGHKEFTNSFNLGYQTNPPTQKRQKILILTKKCIFLLFL